ncbi:unknown [Acidaminococcus sp. CAG:917]|nr:unknown [Acidaminococcus sp. CAG:917]
MAVTDVAVSLACEKAAPSVEPMGIPANFAFAPLSTMAFIYFSPRALSVFTVIFKSFRLTHRYSSSVMVSNDIISVGSF